MLLPDTSRTPPHRGRRPTNATTYFIASKSYAAGALAATAAFIMFTGSADSSAEPTPRTATSAAREASGAPGPTLYVSPAGNDILSGTPAAPLHTFQAALSRLPPSGGTIQLATGNYQRQGLIIGNRSNITVTSTTPHGAVLDEAGPNPAEGNSGVIEIRDSCNITISGLEPGAI